MKVGMVFSPMYPSATAGFGVQQAEALGADSLWTADHLMGLFHEEIHPQTGFGTPGSDPDGFLDPFCLTAALGQSTQIPFGMCVTDSERRGAADLARTAFTLQHLCRGGFKLGIGSGEAMNLTPFEYPFDRPVGRTEELLERLRHLFDTGRFPGTDGRIGVPRESEAGRAEIWLAAHGPRMLRLTGTYADGWLPAFVASPGAYADKAAAIEAHARDAGRPRPELGFQPFTLLGESLERLEEQFEQQPLSKLYALFVDGATWRRHGVEHPLGVEARGFVDVMPHAIDPELQRELAPTIPFSLLREAMIMGSAEEIAAQLEPYARAGCEHVILANMTGLVGGPEEYGARAGDFPRLIGALHEM
jgi:phthiodiolone/phenolphthiodiolone dimycocerosates ketoreductase